MIWDILTLVLVYLISCFLSSEFTRILDKKWREKK